MKIKLITLMAALTGVAGQAVADAGAVAERNVTVCVDGEPSGAGIQVRPVASKMFAAIGVTIDWRRGWRGCPAQSIMINFTSNTPASLQPGALAYARPYEGTHIRVFYDRISSNYQQTLVPRLLAHVLVHEITHILEGVVRHSQSGIMKAQWGLREFDQMQANPLEFADEDINLIHHGLAVREARALVAMGSPPVAAR